MTADKTELKSLFKNGSLPTGDNFATLIDSLVTQKDFCDHVTVYKEWIARGEITLGKSDDAWQIDGVNTDKQLHIFHKTDSPPPAPVDVNIAGVAGMRGRIGTSKAGALFSAEAPAFDVQKLAEQVEIGKWSNLIDPPARACIFEVSAALATTDQESENKIWRFLRHVFGCSKAGNATLHAVVTATGATGKPTFTLLRSPDPQTAWYSLFKWVLALLATVLLVGVLLQSSVLDKHLAGIDTMIKEVVAEFTPDADPLKEPPKEPPAENSQGDVVTSPAGSKDKPKPQTTVEADHIGAWLSQQVAHLLSGTGLINLAAIQAKLSKFGGSWVTMAIVFLLLRSVVVAIRAWLVCIGLRWRKTGGSRLAGTATYTLQMRGPKGIKSSSTTGLRYHITRLWG